MKDATKTLIAKDTNVNLDDGFRSRFLAKIDFNGPMPDQSIPAYQGLGRCQIWTAWLCDRGYGKVLVPNRGCYAAHRIRWVMEHGSIPDGLCVLHKCDNTSCVAPHHLFLGTQVENLIDMTRKGRRNPATKQNGRWSGPKGEKRRVPSEPLRGGNHHIFRPDGLGRKAFTRKLTESDVRAIRGSQGVVSAKSLAEKYSVTPAAVRLIWKRIRWAHLTE